MNLICSKDVTLAYEGHTAAEHVDFHVSEGDYLCVIGENGSGKSTLLRAITGEIKPASGELSVAPELVRGGIGYLPQQSKIQRDFPATVREAVLSGCVARDKLGMIWSRSSKKRADDAMEMLGISNLSKKSFGELSEGQRQRVLLARAICVSEKLLLLDEPVTGLDPDAAHEMYDAIRKINREKKCAVMMVTHDVQCALREAGTVLSMCRGHSFFGTVEEYSHHERSDMEHDMHLHHHGYDHHEGGDTV